MNVRRVTYFVAAIALVWLRAGNAAAAEISLERPGQREFVRDLADMIDSADEQRIRKICDKLLRAKATPIIVVTIESMAKHGGGKLRIETFARLLFNQWEIGHKKLGGRPWNTGILLLVSKQDRKARIELGAGWGREKDARCRQIMDELIIPQFKQGKFSAGIVAGVVALEKMAQARPAPAVIQRQTAREGPAPSLRASDLFALKERCGSAEAVKESYQLVRQHAYGGPEFKTGEILAFEENRFFIYAVGNASNVSGASQDGRTANAGPRFVRRVILLKPSTFVVDDQVRAPASAGPVRWLLHSRGAPQITGRKVRIAAGDGELLCETLLPKKVTLKTTRQAAGDKQPGEHRIEVVPEGDSDEVRLLHVLDTRAGGDSHPAARSELVEKDGRLELTVATDQRVFRLTLSPGSAGADQIAISKADGETLLERRLLPSGILPYGPQGTRLVERWDAAYRGGRRPGWDTGRTSSNLQKAVEDGTLRPCRAVVLGCGTGTNAIYLAGKGFEVTGIDIAPTALTRAGQKAKKAGVKVRWLVADVLAPPKLEPFDLIFDRGCYHGVRRQNAAGYMQAVRRLSRPGTRILILAGNANEPRHYGPPRVKEEEIRGDFSAAFDFQWLRETRFDTRDPAGKGALAWSILLRRKSEKGDKSD